MPTRKLNTIFLNDSFMLQWDYWAPAIVSGPFRRPQDWRRRSLSRGPHGGRCQRDLQEHHQRPAAVGMLADTNRRQLLVIGFGVFRLVDRRHPRALARIRPTQLGF